MPVTTRGAHEHEYQHCCLLARLWGGSLGWPVVTHRGSEAIRAIELESPLLQLLGSPPGTAPAAASVIGECRFPARVSPGSIPSAG